MTRGLGQRFAWLLPAAFERLKRERPELKFEP